MTLENCSWSTSAKYGTTISAASAVNLAFNAQPLMWLMWLRTLATWNASQLHCFGVTWSNSFWPQILHQRFLQSPSIASHLEKLNKNSKMSGLTLIPDNMSICGIFCCLPFMFSLSIPTTSCGKKNRSRVLLMKLEDAAEVESPAFLNSSLAFFSASPWRMLESEMKKKDVR